MNKARLFWMCSFLALLLATLIAGCAEMQMQQTSPTPSPAASSKVIAPVDVASGTQGDSLEACLARIPSNATAGQRQLAELSCHRDERARQPINAVPGK